MADGNSRGQTEAGQRQYFCYQCNSIIPSVLPDFTCPTCHSGFIEEHEGRQGQNPLGAPEDLDSIDFMNFLRGTLMQGGGGPIQMSMGPAGRGRGGGGGFYLNFGTSDRSQRDGNPSGGGGGGGQGADGQPHQNPTNNPVENMLFTFLNDLMTGLGGAQGGGQGPHQHGVPLISNLGDYAWGRDGLDAIVTQLMNQMEGSGPPPLSQEKLDKIERFSISQNEVDNKLQCSVCWENFNLGEGVRKLECEHLYHEDCIMPWLKLHGTCPICRKDLNPPEEGGGGGGSERGPPEISMTFNLGGPPPPNPDGRGTQSNPASPSPPQGHPPPQGSNNPNANRGRGRGFSLGFPFNFSLPFGNSSTQNPPSTQPNNDVSSISSEDDEEERGRGPRGRGRGRGSTGQRSSSNNRLYQMDDEFD